MVALRACLFWLPFLSPGAVGMSEGEGLGEREKISNIEGKNDGKTTK
jgi:hypothetical protein